jgi:hypothetical protein
MLVDAARELPLRDLRRAIDHWRMLADAASADLGDDLRDGPPRRRPGSGDRTDMIAALRSTADAMARERTRTTARRRSDARTRSAISAVGTSTRPTAPSWRASGHISR